jgi:Protein of unknown function (DUF2934)
MADKSAKAPKKSPRSNGEAAKPRRRSTKRPGPSHEQIAERAYHIYLEESGGDELDHWLRAERELSSSSR